MSSEFCSPKYLSFPKWTGAGEAFSRFWGDNFEKTTEKALILSRCKFFGKVLDRDRQNRALIPHNCGGEGVGGGGGQDCKIH